MQPWNIPSVPMVQGHASTPLPHASHHEAKPANEAKSSVVSQASTVDIKPNGRTELPEVFFSQFTSRSIYIVRMLVYTYCLSQG